MTLKVTNITDGTYTATVADFTKGHAFMAAGINTLTNYYLSSVNSSSWTDITTGKQDFYPINALADLDTFCGGKSCAATAAGATRGAEPNDGARGTGGNLSEVPVLCETPTHASSDADWNYYVFWGEMA